APGREGVPERSQRPPPPALSLHAAHHERVAVLEGHYVIQGPTTTDIDAKRRDIHPPATLSGQHAHNFEPRRRDNQLPGHGPPHQDDAEESQERRHQRDEGRLAIHHAHKRAGHHDRAASTALETLA